MRRVSLHRASLPLWCVVLLLLSVPPSWGQQELRSGKKGATNPAPITSTSIDADRQALDVNCVQGCSGSPGSSDGAIVDGVNSAVKATVFDRPNSNPVATQLVDSNGDPVSVGGGTQYNQGTPATDTDTLTMAGCVRVDTPAVATGVIDGDRARCIVDSIGRLWVHVNVVDGTISAIQSGAWNVGQSGAWTVTANAGIGNFTVVQPTGTNLHVVCDSGCSSSAGFADNSAFTFGTTAINPIGGVLDDTATNAATENSAAVARITAQKALHTNLRNNSGTEVGTAGAPLRVDPTGSTTQPVSGTITANAGTGTFAVSGTTFDGILKDGTGDTIQANVSAGRLHVDGSGVTQPVSGTVTANINTFPDNEPFNIAQINGVTPLMGAGNTGTGSPRVTIATDQAALPGMGVYVEDAGETVGGNLAMAGSVRRDTAASSAGTTGDNATINTDASGLLWTRTIDPCSSAAKTFLPFSITTATTTEITPSLAGASTNYYVCSLVLVTAAANNVALVDDDTDGCVSVTSGMAGGTTAASGFNMAANSGMTFGNGTGAVFKTAGTNRVICLVTSAATQLSGTMSVVAAP